jgi:hypothetical protein
MGTWGTVPSCNKRLPGGAVTAGEDDAAGAPDTAGSAETAGDDDATGVGVGVVDVFDSHLW